MTTRAILLLLPLTAFTLHASHTWELNAGYAGLSGDSPAAKSYGARASYFFNSLALAGPEPLAEAEFAERPRTLDFSIGHNEAEYDSGQFETDETHYMIGYTHRGASSPHVLAMGYVYEDSSQLTLVRLTEPPETIFDAHPGRGHSHTARLGYHNYLRPRLTLGLEGTITRGTEALLSDVPGAYESDEERYGVRLVGRMLHPLAHDRWLMASASVGHAGSHYEWRPSDSGNKFSNSRSGTDISATVALYFSRHTSLGLSGTRDGLAEAETLTADARHFFNENVALGVGISRVMPEYSDDNTIYSGELTVRF